MVYCLSCGGEIVYPGLDSSLCPRCGWAIRCEICRKVFLELSTHSVATALKDKTKSKMGVCPDCAVALIKISGRKPPAQARAIEAVRKEQSMRPFYKPTLTPLWKRMAGWVFIDVSSESERLKSEKPTEYAAGFSRTLFKTSC